MKKIRFIRHGHSQANELNLVSGDPTIEYSLSPTGKSQLMDMNLEASDWLVTSDFLRAKETAEILFPNQEITIQPLFRELYYGEYEKLNSSEVMEDFYRGYMENDDSNNKSTYEETKHRAHQALDWLISEMNTKGYSSVSVITHAGFLRMLYFITHDVEYEDVKNIHFKNAEGFELEFE